MNLLTRRAFLAGSIAAAVIAGKTLLEADNDGDAKSASGAVQKVSLIEFTNSGQRKGTIMADKVVKTDAEWQKILSPEQYNVARKGGTERAFSNMLRKLALEVISLPPSRAATSSCRISLAKLLARAWSTAALRCLVVAHLE